MAKHLKFIARTVMVQEGNIEGAYRTLNRILTMDGLIEDIKRRWYCDGSTMKSLVANDDGKATKPVGGSTTWKWLARSTS